MIKDQCDKCRKHENGCTEQIVFNSQSCPFYSKFIDLEKHEKTIVAETQQEDSSISNRDPASVRAEDVAPQSGIETATTVSEPDVNSKDDYSNFVITSEHLKKTTSMHGWLVFFLVVIGIGGLASVIISLASYNANDYGGSTFLALSDIVFAVLIFIVALYTVYAFSERKPNAVFLGKTYVIAIFVSNLLSLFGGDFAESGLGSLPQIIRSIGWSGIWFTYLCKSEQVKTVIPLEYRKKSAFDYYLAIGVFAIPVLFMVIGLNELRGNQETQTQAFLETVELKENEYTDGRIVFTRPYGFTCEKQELADPANYIIFNLESDEIGNVIICSDYDSDESVKKFNSYCAAWEDEDLKKLSSREMVNEKKSINGHNYYYKITKYDIDGTDVFWRFVLMFDKSMGKVCVVSGYDAGYEKYIDEIINSIRFE